MINAYIDSALAALAAVYVTDVSGFTDSWRSLTARLLGVNRLRPLPPFDCGECMAFWSALITAAVLGVPLLTALAWACLCSLLSAPAGQAMLLLREGLNHIINKLLSKL